jgi:hypothetical protein
MGAFLRLVGGPGIDHTARSAVEDRPAEVVAQSLVVEDEVTDGVRELVALPAALGSPGGFSVAVRGCGTNGPDGIRGRTQLVRRDVRRGGGLRSGVGGVARRTPKVPGSGVRVTGGRPGDGHGDLAPGPRPGQLDGVLRTLVVRADPLEMLEDVRGAVGRPHRERVVVIIRQ